MKRRFTKLPIASIAVVIGSLLIGLSMSPVGAQSGLTNGQVVVRSDGAVYLISNSQRRWVATVQITDEEINAYPEAEPIYSGLVPFGSAGTAATTTGTGTGSAAAPKTGTGASTASKTSPGSTTTKVASKSSAKTASNSSPASGANEEVTPGQVVVNPSSGADQKDPNDPTLAAGSAAVDPTGKTQPTDATTCPASHQVKGGFDKKYYDVDRPQYATAEVEVCFRTGKDARDNGYTEAKKN